MIVPHWIEEGIFHDLSVKPEADVSHAGEHAGFSEQQQEQICALSPLLGFTAEPKAVSQGQLQQKTELPITRQSLQGKVFPSLYLTPLTRVGQEHDQKTSEPQDPFQTTAVHHPGQADKTVN